MRPSIGLRPRQLLSMFDNYMQVGDYTFSCTMRDALRYQQLLTKRYGVTTVFEAMKLSEAQQIEAAIEVLGQPQRIRPLIRKLWRNRLVRGASTKARQARHFCRFGEWPTPV